jgi:outer membrane protein
MKYLKTIAALGLLLAILRVDIAVGAQQKIDGSRKEPITGAAKATESSATVSATQPCTLARSVVEQLGKLDHQIPMLPSVQSFAAVNGTAKLVVACGISFDETYTYSRVLAGSGIGLLVFKGDEAPDRVLQQLADRLGLDFPQSSPGAAQGAGVTYVFSAQAPGGKTARVTVTPAAPAANAPTGLSQENLGSTPFAGGLRDLYLLAKANDPELGRSQARVVASKADTDVVRAGFHPRVDASAGLSQIDQTVLNYPPTTTHSSVFGYNYDISARMPVLHLPTYHYLSSATAAMRGEAAGASAAQQNLIVKLADAYFSLLKARTDEQIARDELARLKQILDQAQAFLKAGTGDIISVFEAQARRDGVTADLNQAESTLRLAEQKLAGIVKKPVTAMAGYRQLQPTEPEPDDLDWWLTTMEKQDPLILQAREGLTQTLEQTKAVKAERYPVVDLGAGYDVSKGSAFLPDVETRQWHLGATVSVSLYSGGEATARIQRAVANQDERSYQLAAILEQRRENMKQSFFNLRYNVSLVKALKQKENSSEIQLNAVRKGRSLGTRTAIDLLNAEQSYSMAKRDLENALYDNVVKVILLKSAAGILDEADLAGN